MGLKEAGKGTIWYGMHFYAGPAQYQESGKQPYRVLLNENTIRAMDPTFAGRPVFVHHVDGVDPDLNELRKEADGWVMESFFNKADGKHWVKFIVVSDKAERAIKAGMRLSNCYVPTSFGPAGVWNGIDYDKEIKSGEYEHLAIVPNPRYDESVIMSPEEFKKYNSDKDFELLRLANHKDKGEKKVKWNFFKKEKVENSADLETMSVELPNSKKEVSLAVLINAADKEEMEKDKPKIAEQHHLVDCMGKTMTVNELVAKHERMCDELEEMKKPKDEEPKDSSEDQDMETAEKPVPKSDDEKESQKESDKVEKKEEKEVKDSNDDDEKEKRKNAIEKAERLRNAPDNYKRRETAAVYTSADFVQRGKQYFGS